MATNPDTEGEPPPCTSPGYCALWVKITRLAYGIPVGSHLEYADDATLMRAWRAVRRCENLNAALPWECGVFTPVLLGIFDGGAWAPFLRDADWIGLISPPDF